MYLYVKVNQHVRCTIDSACRLVAGVGR